MSDPFSGQNTPGAMTDTPMPLDDFEPYPPKWPKVIGWMSLGFGTLGVLCTACGGVMIVAMPAMLKGNPGVDPNNLPPFMHVSPIMYGQLGFGVLLSLLLLAAGGLTMGRQKLGRTLHLVWAPLGIISGCLGIFMQVKNQWAMDAWVLQNPDSMFAKQQSPIGYIIGLSCGAILGLAWPIFCLIWFGLVKRRAEQMIRRDPGPGV